LEIREGFDPPERNEREPQRSEIATNLRIANFEFSKSKPLKKQLWFK
jgi:hypothetical protein